MHFERKRLKNYTKMNYLDAEIHLSYSDLVFCFPSDFGIRNVALAEARAGKSLEKLVKHVNLERHKWNPSLINSEEICPGLK